MFHLSHNLVRLGKTSTTVLSHLRPMFCSHRLRGMMSMMLGHTLCVMSTTIRPHSVKLFVENVARSETPAMMSQIRSDPGTSDHLHSTMLMRFSFTLTTTDRQAMSLRQQSGPTLTLSSTCEVPISISRNVSGSMK